MSVKCGIHRNIAPSDYRAWDAINYSSLVEIDRSPLHCRQAITGGRVETPAMRLGSATHVAVLQPDLLASLYAVAGQCEAKTKKGEQCSKGGSVCIDGHWFCGTHEPESGTRDARIVLAEADYAACVAMRDAVYANPGCKKLLAFAHDVELSMAWTDANTGLACKGRADWFCESRGILLDLKTTADASYRGFERTIADREYHGQLAFYGGGLTACGSPVKTHLIIAVENTAPYAVAFYRITSESIEVGQKENANRLATYSQCLKTNNWPGYPVQVQDMSLPAWKLRQAEQLL